MADKSQVLHTLREEIYVTDKIFSLPFDVKQWHRTKQFNGSSNIGHTVASNAINKINMCCTGFAEIKSSRPQIPYQSTVRLILKPSLSYLGILSNFFELEIYQFEYLMHTSALAKALKLENITLISEHLTKGLSKERRRHSTAELSEKELETLLDTVWVTFFVAQGQTLTIGPGTEVTFAVRTANGWKDPSVVLEKLRDFILDGQAETDQFFLELPKTLPTFSNTTPEDVISASQVSLYSMAALELARRANQISHKDWRTIGDYQKTQWFKKLSARLSVSTGIEPFQFDPSGIDGAIQLESVAQFYFNYNEPSIIPNSPLSDATLLGNNKVQFLDPYGNTANAIDGEWIQLEPGVDISGVDNELDYFVWLRAGIRQRGSRVIDVDATNCRVKVEEVPDLTGLTRWCVTSPRLILIDPFGPRMQGIDALENGSTTIILADSAIDNYSRSYNNINRWFDTIYLENDLVRQSRRYRIMDKAIVGGKCQLTLDGVPSFSGGRSAWYLPAGLGGPLPTCDYNLSGRAARYPQPANGQEIDEQEKDLHDHYDGILAIVYASDDGVHFQSTVSPIWRWSSFSTHHPTQYSADGKTRFWDTEEDWRQCRSSIRGNKKYYYEGRLGRYVWAITENASRPWEIDEDYALQARKYYEEMVVDDSALASSPPDPNSSVLGPGKTQIRIHLGNRARQNGYCGSIGCLTSPDYASFDAAMRDIWTGILGEHASQINMIGAIYVVRPDERSIG